MKLSQEQLKKVRAARSPQELGELARAEGVTLTPEEAQAHFAKLHPPVGELADDELEAVSGGGCGGAPDNILLACKFKVGDHVMHNHAPTCGGNAGGGGGSCPSTYWIVTEVSKVISSYHLWQWNVSFSCPECGAQGECDACFFHFVS